MLAEYASIINQKPVSLLTLGIILYVLLLHPLVVSAGMSAVLAKTRKRISVIKVCILFLVIAISVPLFHAWLLVTQPELSEGGGWKGVGVLFAMNLSFGSLLFEVFTRPFLLKAWYGKEAYQKMISAPDYSEKIVVYSHAVAVKILGTVIYSSLWLGIIISTIIAPLHLISNARIIALGVMFFVVFGNFFHLYVTQHLFKCDCCGRKALHSVYEHPVYPKSWVRQLHPIAVNNCFRCVFCRVQYALSRKTLHKLQQKQAEQKRMGKEKGQVSEQ